MRLIDSDALDDKLEALVQKYTAKGRPEVAKDYSFVQTVLLTAPTVDAVEVVRCKDCRWARAKDHREPTDTPRQLICQCVKHHHIPALWGARMAVSPDDFCSYGERREGE